MPFRLVAIGSTLLQALSRGFRQCMAIALILMAFLPAAWALDTVAERALVLDLDSGSPIFAKNIDASFAPGNFTKLLAIAVVFDALKKGDVTEDAIYSVSDHAWRSGGAPAKVTAMFAKLKEKIAVGDLLRGLIVAYGNDAAIALAEGLAGSETVFTQRMNALARKLGMAQSRFVNPTGFADPMARTSFSDLVKIFTYLRTEHGDRYGLFAEKEFTWNKIRQLNKTGYIASLPGSEAGMIAYDEKAGFSAAVAVTVNGRHLLVMAGGLPDAKSRDAAIRGLVDYVSSFQLVDLFPSGEEIGKVRVFGGTVAQTPVTGKGTITVTLPKVDRSKIELRLAYDGPVPAPISRGDEIARLEVRIDNQVFQTVPLYAAENVGLGDLTSRARDSLTELLFSWF